MGFDKALLTPAIKVITHKTSKKYFLLLNLQKTSTSNKMFPTIISIIGLLKGASSNVQVKDAKAPLYIHAKSEALPSIHTVLLSFE